ncbi:hypothetical protein HK096_007538, partial [Nowakowskiella sp. JEL0078]
MNPEENNLFRSLSFALDRSRCLESKFSSSLAYGDNFCLPEKLNRINEAVEHRLFQKKERRNVTSRLSTNSTANIPLSDLLDFNCEVLESNKIKPELSRYSLFDHIFPDRKSSSEITTISRIQESEQKGPTTTLTNHLQKNFNVVKINQAVKSEKNSKLIGNNGDQMNEIKYQSTKAMKAVNQEFSMQTFSRFQKLVEKEHYDTDEA